MVRLSDITFVVGQNGQRYFLHLIVLAASSEVFRIMCQCPLGMAIGTVYLDVTEDCAAVFEDFIQYIYTGHITLNLDTVDAIITLADRYQVWDLKKIAQNFLEKHEPKGLDPKYLEPQEENHGALDCTFESKVEYMMKNFNDDMSKIIETHLRIQDGIQAAAGINVTKSKLNPNAKEFGLNPKAKEFVPPSARPT